MSEKISVTFHYRGAFSVGMELSPERIPRKGDIVSVDEAPGQQGHQASGDWEVERVHWAFDYPTDTVTSVGVALRLPLRRH